MKRSFRWGPGALNTLFAPDTNSGGDGGEAPKTEPVQATDKATPATPTEVKDLPEWAQKLVTELRTENAQARTAKTKLEKDAQAAEEQRLANEKKWEELAGKHQSKLTQLEPQLETLTGRIASYEALFAKQLETETKAWPDEVKALDPGKDASFEARMAWLEKARPLVAKLTATPIAQGTGRLPKPSNQALDDKAKFPNKVASIF